MVLAQAAASGLPIITTPNCAGPDIVRHDRTGWIIPIRSADAIVHRLEWCDAHRDHMAALLGDIEQQYQPRDWSHVARDFAALATERLMRC